MKTSARKKPASRAEPVPDNESERLSVLNRYCILDTPPESCFDDLTELAAIICKVPVATITLVDKNRQWYKSRVGITDKEAPRDISFCAHTILGKDLLIIPDTFKDNRFSSNPFVTDDPPLRFYAAVPLITQDGYALGTLCVIDHVPRRLNSDQKKALKTLARQVMAQMELRRKTIELQENLSKRKEADAVKKINRELKAEIDTRKQIEVALEKSRLRLALALECAGAGIWDWDMINNEIVWNKEHEKLFGFGAGTFDGNYEQFKQRIHPDDKAGINEAIKHSIDNKSDYHHEFRVVWPDNSIHWMEGTGRFVFDKTDHPIRMYGVVREITERKHAENKLREEQRKLSTLISNMPGMVYRCKNDPDWTLEFASKNIEELSGYSLEDFYSGRNHCGRIIHPDDTQAVWDQVQEAVSRRSTYEIEYRIIHADGSIKWIWEQGLGIFDQDGNFEALEGVVFDITEHKEIDRALRESEEKFSKAFHSNPLSMIINRLSDGRLIDINISFTRIVGYSRDEAIGKTPLELSIWIQPAERDRYIQILKRDGHIRNFETRIRRKDGKIRIHSLSAEIITLNGEDCVVTMGEDITERKQIEQKLLFTQFAVDHAADSIYWLKKDASVLYVNDAACKELGYSRDELLSMKVYDFNPDMTKEIWRDRWEKNKLEKPLFIETRHKRKDGQIIPVEITANRVEFEDEEFNCAIVRDISDRRRTEKLLIVEKYILKLIATGYDLHKIMNECCNGVEELLPGAMCSVLLLESDGATLRHYSAPSLPESYNKFIDGIKIGPNAGSCGTAAYFGKRVIVRDIYTDNLWSDYRDLAAKYNLRACWSTPIHVSTGKVVGIFAIYFKYPCTPSVSNNELIDRMSHLAGIAYEKDITTVALIESEEKFRSIVETTSEWIWECDLDGNHIYSNKTANVLLGYDNDDCLAKNAFELIHPDDRNIIRDKFQDCIKNKTGWKGWIIRWLHQNGEYRYTESNATPIFNQNNELNGFRGSDRDITERIHSENELRRSEAMLSEAQHVAHMGSWEVDHKLHRLTWSDECYRIFEVNKDTFRVSYESFLDAVHPDDREKVDEAFRKAVKKQSIYDINHRLLFQDGRIKYINEKCKTYYDEYGEPLRSVGTTIDFTREKLAEMELEAKARQQQFIAKLGRLSLAKRDLADIFDMAVTGLAEILDVEYSKILELQPDAKQFVLVAGYGWEDGMIGQAAVGAGLDSQAGYTLNQNKPVVVEDLETESRFSGPQLLLDHGIASGISVIIEGRDKPYGVLGIHSRNHRQFSQYDVDFVQAIGVLLAEAIEHEFVAEQILSSRQRLRNLAARLQAVREEERTRISQEIHDELGQTLTGLRIDLSWIHNQLQEDKDLSKKVHAALQLADSTLDSVRRISHDLRPPILDDLGLEAAIEWQVEEFRRYSHCQCNLEINVGDIGIQNERDTVIFRILQEALTNIARHANADRVEVKLLNLNRRLILKVTDNGSGINKNAIDSNDSIGLIGMRERAGILGGRVDIQEGNESGTVVRLVIPLSKKGTYNA